MLSWQRRAIDDAARAGGRDPSAIQTYVRINVATGAAVGQVADAVGLLADNGYPDAFVDMLYVADRDRRPPRVGGTAAGAGEPGMLASLRVLDLGGAESDGVGRLFADLGADVLKIEPPGGSIARGARPPWRAPASRSRCRTRTSAARCSIRRLTTDRQRLDRLGRVPPTSSSTAGIRGAAAHSGRRARQLAERFGHLVALSVTDFGTAGPYASWRATDAVLVHDVDRAVADRADDGHAGAATRRRGVGNGGGAGRMGGAGRLLSPVTLRQRRLHRLLPFRGGPAVRSTRPTGPRVRRRSG